MTIFEKVLVAESLADVVAFFRACEAQEKTGRDPAAIAWDMTYAHASDFASDLCHTNPTLERLMDLTPDLEIKNGTPDELNQMWIEIKQCINTLDKQAKAETAGQS